MGNQFLWSETSTNIYWLTDNGLTLTNEIENTSTCTVNSKVQTHLYHVYCEHDKEIYMWHNSFIAPYANYMPTTHNKIEKHKQEILAVTSTALKRNLIGTDWT